jgi:hypothetical protein
MGRAVEVAEAVCSSGYGGMILISGATYGLVYHRCVGAWRLEIGGWGAEACGVLTRVGW